MRTTADPRTRVLDAAATLLRDRGATAVTTRAVSEAAGVQAPALYRLFGDKDGLLVAAAEHVLSAWVAEKQASVEQADTGDVDPVVDLRNGWESQIAFSVDHPSVFRLLSDPDLAERSPSLAAGRRVLEARVHRLAQTGRLRVSQVAAVELFMAVAAGTVQVLLRTPPDQRDPSLSARSLDAVLHQVLADQPPASDDPARTAAVTLRAGLPAQSALSPAERALMAEWLDRITGAAAAP